MRPLSAALIARIPPFVKNRKWKIISFISMIFLLTVIYMVFFWGNDVKTQSFYVTCVSDKNIIDSCDVKIFMDYSGKAKTNQNKVPSCQVVPYCNLKKAGNAISNISYCYGRKYLDSIASVVNVKIKLNKTAYFPKLGIANDDMFDNGEYWFNWKLNIEHDSIIKEEMVVFDSNMYIKYGGKNNKELIPFSHGVVRSTDFSNNFWINPRNITTSCLILKFERMETRNICLSIDYMAPMNFMTISPEPDVLESSIIRYHNKEKIDYILTNGLYVYSESLLNKNSYEMMNFVLATVIGCLFSMIIDLIYRIFRK